MAITISGTTGVAGVDGSASAPSVVGTDSNSGVYFGADTIKFSTGGTERMSITNSGVAGAGLFTSYAVIVDQKSQNTEAGTFTQDAWQTRDLNTEGSDPDGIVSISSNKFTLAAGNYLIIWSAPCYKVDKNQTRLYDVTNTAAITPMGSVEHANTSVAIQVRSTGSARVSPSGSTEYRIEHKCAATRSGNGFGFAANLAAEIFTIVEIYKEA